MEFQHAICVSVYLARSQQRFCWLSTSRPSCARTILRHLLPDLSVMELGTWKNYTAHLKAYKGTLSLYPVHVHAV